MAINWFPGHMVKTKREIKENLKLVDAVIEIRDARIPNSSKNPDIDQLCKGKPRIILLNKCDLANEKITKEWKKSLENNLATIEKENGQVEKSIKEVESTLDWNSIQQKATEQLGMQKKSGTPVDLEKSDNVETTSKFIKSEKSNFIEKVIEYFINK